MDRRKQRKIRRSGTQQGAQYVLNLIKRAMARALKNDVPLSVAVPQYLSTIPPVEFETLMNHVDALDISDPLLVNIKNEVEARYLLK